MLTREQQDLLTTEEIVEILRRRGEAVIVAICRTGTPIASQGQIESWTEGNRFMLKAMAGEVWHDLMHEAPTDPV